MFNLNITIRCLLLLVIAWPGPRLVVHSHVDYLGQCGNGFLLAMHMQIYHGDHDSNSGVPGTPHSHWVCGGSDFDKPLPVLFTDVLNMASTDLEDLTSHAMTRGCFSLELLPLSETTHPSLHTSLDQASLNQPDQDILQLCCKSTC